MPSDFVNPTVPSTSQNLNDPFPSNPSTVQHQPYSGNNAEPKKNWCNNPLWGPIVLVGAFVLFAAGAVSSDAMVEFLYICALHVLLPTHISLFLHVHNIISTAESDAL